MKNENQHNEMRIVNYTKENQNHFERLNKAWLNNKFFEVEPLDESLLSQPEKFILNKGGHIFFRRI
ncbi:MAG: hypothetical protein R2765_11290 [Ferruginibacter sp.]